MDGPAANSAAWEGALTLGDILATAGVTNLSDVLVIRHTVGGPGLADDSAVNPNGVLEYTRDQELTTLKFPKAPPRHWLVFIADGQLRSRFFTSYTNEGEALGERTHDRRRYHLAPSSLLHTLSNRLVIEWGRDPVNWAKMATKAASFRVLEISDPVALPFPGHLSIDLSFTELVEATSSLRYRQWQSALGSVKGIYLITDIGTGGLYVGKADGADGILGRWRQYASTQHGDNVMLRAAIAADPKLTSRLRWSVLQVFGSSATPADVDAAEAHFKRVLVSRRFGFNAN